MKYLKYQIIFNTLLISICLICSSVSAKTIEVFLTHQSKITGIADAQQQGYQIQYYYLDGVSIIEEKLSQKTTAQYQQPIDSLVQQYGIDKLNRMSESQRSLLFQQHLKRLGIRMPSVSLLLSPQDRKDLQQATMDIQYANDQGVSLDILPAVIMDQQLMTHVQDLGELLSSIAGKKTGGER